MYECVKGGIGTITLEGFYTIDAFSCPNQFIVKMGNVSYYKLLFFLYGLDNMNKKLFYIFFPKYIFF